MQATVIVQANLVPKGQRRLILYAILAVLGLEYFDMLNSRWEVICVERKVAGFGTNSGRSGRGFVARGTSH